VGDGPGRHGPGKGTPPQGSPCPFRDPFTKLPGAATPQVPGVATWRRALWAAPGSSAWGLVRGRGLWEAEARGGRGWPTPRPRPRASCGVPNHSGFRSEEGQGRRDTGEEKRSYPQPKRKRRAEAAAAALVAAARRAAARAAGQWTAPRRNASQMRRWALPLWKRERKGPRRLPRCSRTSSHPTRKVRTELPPQPVPFTKGMPGHPHMPPGCTLTCHQGAPSLVHQGAPLLVTRVHPRSSQGVPGTLSTTRDPACPAPSFHAGGASHVMSHPLSHAERCERKVWAGCTGKRAGKGRKRGLRGSQYSALLLPSSRVMPSCALQCLSSTAEGQCLRLG